jgi:hypothetical protein
MIAEARRWMEQEPDPRGRLVSENPSWVSYGRIHYGKAAASVRLRRAVVRVIPAA